MIEDYSKYDLNYDNMSSANKLLRDNCRYYKYKKNECCVSVL